MNDWVFARKTKSGGILTLIIIIILVSCIHYLFIETFLTIWDLGDVENLRDSCNSNIFAIHFSLLLTFHL